MTKQTIAIMTADKRMARFLSLELETLGYDTLNTESGENVEGAVLMIVDADMVSELRQAYRVPLLFVSSRQETGSGTLPWPMDIEQLREAVRAAVAPNTRSQKKSDGRAADKNICVINRSVGAVTVEGLSVKLSENELKVLETLCEANGEAVSRLKIMDILGADEGNASDVYICHLRRKLELPLGKRLIFTVRGKGYRTVLTVVKK